MKILVLGGDGFCGWPASLKLSSENHEVVIVDNFLRRKIDKELKTNSLTPIQSLSKRVSTWKKISGRKISYHKIDIAKEYKKFSQLVNRFKPRAIVHFAEQRSAPYSMKNTNNKVFTLENNLKGTLNVLNAIVENDKNIHLIHLGTTGYYGYSDNNRMKIPEGYLKVKVQSKKKFRNLEILYPPNPGSIYHLTKCQDALMFQFYNKNDNLRITDLHQGIVWGTQTNETRLHEDLINRFDYDGIFGTVLNRFIVQSQIEHPLTIYGTGGQTRAFIHIKDSVECIKLAVANSPKLGDRYRVLNQTTECHNLKTLAKKIRKITGAKIKFYKNPRIELSKNYLDFVKTGFQKLGLKPTYLDVGLIQEIFEIVGKYKIRIDRSKIFTKALWSRKNKFDITGKKKEQ